MSLPPLDPLPAEKDALVRLMKGVVLAQGNVFIKELLRSRGIKIGTTKADFEENMMAAIESGQLQRQHVDSWLNEVEGWGNQHVYLFTVSQSMCADPVWQNPKKVEAKVRSGGFAKQWNAQTSLEYPTTRALTGIYFEDGSLRFVWHKGLEFWARDKTKDYRQEIDADTYEFRAYRMRAERSVTRFELHPTEKLAAIFVQIAVDEEEHTAAVNNVKTTIDRLWSFKELSALALATPIKKLDTRSLTKGDITAYSTRLNSGEAYVEFGARSLQYSYQDSTPVREVRKSVRGASFTGTNGSFSIPVTEVSGKERRIRIQLYGEQRRVKLPSQMTASQVWSVLRLIRENA